MKSVFTSAVIAITILLAACRDNPTNIDTSTGEIYGYCRIFNEYGEKLADQSGLTAQLLEEDKILQITTSTPDGLISFKDVPASVYTIRIFKPGYAQFHAYTFPDTLLAANVQFVGHGRYRLTELSDQISILQFNSTAEPDSLHCSLKQDIRYEIIKDSKTLTNILVRIDTIGMDTTGGNGHYKPILKNIYGSGTEEKQKIRFIVDYEHPMGNIITSRTVMMSVKVDNSQTQKYAVSSESNAISAIYEYDSPNTIIRDSQGLIVNRLGESTIYTKIVNKNISIQATSTIPNALKRSKAPQRLVKTKELSVNLLD